jgi:hypothetical protein
MMGTHTHLGGYVSLDFGLEKPLPSVSTGECDWAKAAKVMHLQLFDDSLTIKNKILGRLSLICSLPSVPNMTLDFKSRCNAHMSVDTSGKTQEDTVPKTQI